jgi:hypothetical protein
MSDDTKSSPQIASPPSPASHPGIFKGLRGDEGGRFCVTGVDLLRHQVASRRSGDAGGDAVVTQRVNPPSPRKYPKLRIVSERIGSGDTGDAIFAREPDGHQR